MAPSFPRRRESRASREEALRAFLDPRPRGDDGLRAAFRRRPQSVTCTPFQNATRSFTICASGFGSG